MATKRSAGSSRRSGKAEALIITKDCTGKKHWVKPSDLLPPPPGDAMVFDLGGKDGGQTVANLGGNLGWNRSVNPPHDEALLGVLRVGGPHGDLLRILARAPLYEQVERRRTEYALRRQREGADRRASRVRREAGRGKAGRLSPQVRLIRATVQVLKDEGQPHEYVAVLAVLTEWDDLDPELADRIRQEAEPLDLDDDRPPVKVTDKDNELIPVSVADDSAKTRKTLQNCRVFFQITNYSKRSVCMARFKNAVAEAGRTKR